MFSRQLRQPRGRLHEVYAPWACTRQNTFFLSLTCGMQRFFVCCQVKSSQVKSSQVKSSQVKSSQVKSSQVKSSQVKSSQVKSSQVKSSQVRSGQVRSGQVRSGQVRSGQVKSCRVESSRVESSRVESSRVKSSQVMSSQVKSNQVKVRVHVGISGRPHRERLDSGTSCELPNCRRWILGRHHLVEFRPFYSVLRLCRQYSHLRMTTWHWLAVEEHQGKWNRKCFRGGDDPSWSIVTFVNRCLGDPE